MFRKLRVLCLHGYGQSGDHLRRRLEGLFGGAGAGAYLRDSFEFVCVDGPHTSASAVTSPRPPGTTNNGPRPAVTSTTATATSGAPSYRWASYHVLSRTPEPLRFSTFWEGFPETLRYLGRVFRNQGPFDGLLGFSQGGMVVHHLVNFVGARYGGDFERAADAYEAGFSDSVRADLIANAGDVLPHIKGVTYDGLAGDAADRKIAALPAGPVQNWGPLSTVRFVVSLSSAVPHDSSFPTAGRLQARRPRFPELSCLSMFHESDTVVRPEKSKMGLEGNYGDVLLVEESRRSSSTGPGGSDFSEEDDRQKMNAHRAVPRWEELSEENQGKLITFVEQMQQKVALYDALLGRAADDATSRPDVNKRIGGQPAFLAKQVDVATGTAPDVLDGSTRRSKL